MAQEPHDLLHHLRASLRAKIDRLLRQPLIGAVVGAEGSSKPPTGPTSEGTGATPPADGHAATQPDHEETFRVRVAFDEIPGVRIDQVLSAALEGPVTLLDDEQAFCLRSAPRSFLELRPGPQVVELVEFARDMNASTFLLTLATPPNEPARVRHVAIVPNLVQLQRQLDALALIAASAADGPLAPLRALLGLGQLPVGSGAPTEALARSRTVAGARTDPHQGEAIASALATPHFSVIQGPPGSGKTTVIRQVIEQAVARGGRVLVVSPTHVAVDNVVERLVDAREPDALAPHTLPVRFAARKAKLSPRALAYWVGPRRELRGAAVGRRVEQRLRAAVPFAAALLAKERREQAGCAPLSMAVAAVAPVLCGTPIGILSCELVREAPPGSFDLCVVDEVSKMLLPEFLAIAVKAKRWLLVGDPEQLPPFMDAEESAATLEDVLPPKAELVASVGAFLDTPAARRREEGLLVVASNPQRMVDAIRAHVASAGVREPPAVGLAREPLGVEAIRVAGPEVLDHGARELTSTHGPIRTLIERGLAGSASRPVPVSERAGALLFQYAARIYHTQPWTRRVDQRVRALGCKNGFRKLLPTREALDALACTEASLGVNAIEQALVVRYAVNAISVYDWLVRGPAGFDCPFLDQVAAVLDNPIRDAVAPYVARLATQYRMHPTLSRVPRELFYGGRLLRDATQCAPTPREAGCGVELMHVESRCDAEENVDEVERAVAVARRLRSEGRASGEVLIITPYRAQEAALARRLERIEGREGIEICTLDRCQGREADYVVLSLVRRRATAFLESPKRWNVALTRARRGLVVVGDLAAYRAEAANARREIAAGYRAAERRPLMSVLARIIEAYDGQLAAAGGAP